MLCLQLPLWICLIGNTDSSAPHPKRDMNRYYFCWAVCSNLNPITLFLPPPPPRKTPVQTTLVVSGVHIISEGTIPLEDKC